MGAASESLASSPTVATEEVLITGVIDAREHRDVLTLDIPNAFVQTKIPESNVKTIMRIRGKLVDLLLDTKRYMACLNPPSYIIKSSDETPYDSCVANRNVDGSQHTITWHVDDVKSSHVNPRVNDEFALWCENNYGSGQGHVKIVRGNQHDYLATSGTLVLDMRYYIANIMEQFPVTIKPQKTPWTENLMKVEQT